MYYPLQGSLEIPRGRRVVEANIFKAKLQFPEVGGGGGGRDIFWINKLWSSRRILQNACLLSIVQLTSQETSVIFQSPQGHVPEL